MKLNKKNILFIATGNDKWIGGLYYIKNMIFSLMQSEEVDCGNIKIYILVNNESRKIFINLLNNKNIELILLTQNPFVNFVNKVGNKIISKFFNRIFDINIIMICNKMSIRYIYPITGYPFFGVKKKCIYWIPDFQHIFLPSMFSKEEILRRTKLYNYISKNNNKLVLSSEDAFKHYKNSYREDTTELHIVHFLSYIEDIVKDINTNYIHKVLKKYCLPDKYIFVPNQFWKHKNHLCLFKAMNEIVNCNKKDILLICTGNTNDYRNKEYFNELISYIKSHNLEKNIKILGFISRKEQLAIMAGANVIIQPSLFEGWGTSVEDAKALGKKIIMSDIDVHYEQANNNCIIFEKENHKMLAHIIIENFDNGNEYKYSNVVSYTRKSAKKYSEEFIKVFN